MEFIRWLVGYAREHPAIATVNVVTFSRGILTVPVSWLYLSGSHWWALFWFVIAALTDAADGWLARRWEATTDFGKALDPLADKLFILGTMVPLMFAGIISGWHQIPAWIIIVREVAMAVFSGGSRRVMTPTLWAKRKTEWQSFAVGFLLVATPHMLGEYAAWSQAIGLLLLWAASVLTALTGIHYFVMWWQEKKETL
jgi:CDP-diacylglycerol--glycerol-3-phosphate 3-phosphatidyltransferase